MASIPKQGSVLLKPLSIHFSLIVYVHSFFDHLIKDGEMIGLLYCVLALTTLQAVWDKQRLLRKEKKENEKERKCWKVSWLCELKQKKLIMTALLVAKHRPAEIKCLTSQKVGPLADVLLKSNASHSCQSMCSPRLYWSFLQRERSKITLSIQKKNYLILLKLLTSLHNCLLQLWKAMARWDSNLC